MAREGKKIDEFEIYPRDAKGNRLSKSFPAVLRMTESYKFVLEVNQLRFEGRTPADLVHQARMQLENEDGLNWEPRILVDPDLDEGRLTFRRVFVATSKDGREIYRLWRFAGDDEKQLSRWESKTPATFSRLDGATPGDRTDEARLKDREMPYTPERWAALVKLGGMLDEAHKAVADKLHDIIRGGDLDGFLKRTATHGTPRMIFDEASKG
jgi:hypothetical protein